jgi:hypothetical protein
MANGRKTGGRVKGVPNKVTGAARLAFLAVFDSLAPDLETWIQQTANGWDAEIQTKIGPVIVRQGKDPAKAADLLIRMAEYHLPKLGRQEIVGDGGGAIQVQIVKFSEPDQGKP